MKKIIISVLFFCISNYLLAQMPTISDVQPPGGGASKSSACIGEVIRIIGSNYIPGGMTIVINNGPVISIYNFVNPTTIELQVPPGTPASGTGIVVTATSLTSNARGIAINPAPTITTQPVDQSVCDGKTYTFTANVVGAISYAWRRNGTLTGQTTQTITGTAAAIDSGDVYSVDVVTSGCGTVVPFPAKLLVNTHPIIPPSLPNINQCQNGTFNLVAPAQNIGIGVWNCHANCGGVNIASAVSPTTTVTGVPPQQFPQLYWIVTNGQCKDSTVVNLLNYGMPTTAALAGADADLCVSSPTIALTGNTPSGLYTNVDWIVTSPLTGTFAPAGAQNTVFTPTGGPGTYKLNYIIRNGACNSISPDKTVKLYDLPTVVGGSFTGCFGTNISLSATALNATAVSWAQTGGWGSLNSSSILTPVYTPMGDDSLGQNVSFVITASNPGCGSGTDNVSLQVYAKPHAYIPVGTDTSICSGATVTIPIIFDGAPPFSGIGLFNGSFNSPVGTVSGYYTGISVTPVGNTNYTLAPVGTFRDGNNCPGVWYGNSNVSILPGATSTISVVPATICSGDNALLSLSPSGGGGPTWKIYYNTGGANSTLVLSGNMNIPISPTTTTTYTIDSIETAGCGKMKLVGVSKTVNVNSPPTVSASMTIDVSDDTLCKGETTIISISGLQANTVYKLIETFNSLALDSIVVGNTSPGTLSVSIPYSKFVPGTIDTIRFRARRTGCAGSVPSITKAYVWVSNLLTPTISVVGNTPICDRKILNFTPIQANVSHRWYNGTSFIVGAGDKDTAYSPGSYTVKVKDTLFCTSVSIPFVVDYSSMKPTTSTSDVSLTETKITADQAAQKYRWYAQTTSGIKRIVGDTLGSISVYFDGYYYLGVINNSCFQQSDPIPVTGRLGGNLLKQSFTETDSTIILPKMDLTTDVVVFPNPVSNADFTVDYIAGNATKVSFILYNPQGTPVFSTQTDGNGLITLTIPTKQYTAGIYSLYINDGVKQVRKNVMIY